MANVKGGKDHSDSIETLAGKTLRDPNAGKVAKRLAGAVIAHGDGKNAAKPAPKKAPAKAAAPKPSPKAPAKAPPKKR
ncbi:MAG: hypothetical protein ACOH2N_00545 [Devosia sp.]